jgi:signal transduction histidine kinase
MAGATPETTLNAPAIQHRLFSLLLIYRWVSLSLALWLFWGAVKPAAPAPAILLAITGGVTFIITLFYCFNRPALRRPLFLATDLLVIAALLAVSGAGRSHFSLYALSPLLVGAYFYQGRGMLLTTGGLTLFYLLALPAASSPITSPEELRALLTQLAGLWLLSFLFGYSVSLFKQLLSYYDSLAMAHDRLNDQNTALVADLHQLEMMQELTLFLQGAPDRQTVQHRLLKAVTENLGFSQAIAGLTHPTLQRLEAWQSHPPQVGPLPEPLWLNPEGGLLAQAVLGRQLRWASKEALQTNDEVLSHWLSREGWLILPMVWQGQTVGVLLVAVEQTGSPGASHHLAAEDGPAGIDALTVDATDDRWAILTSLVSQAAAALNTLDRTRRLAGEKERNRIARDIHDTVAQSLFGIAFTLDACIKLLPEQVETVKQELEDLRAITDRVRQELRQFILDIWPSELTREKFQADLCKYLTHTAPDHVFNVEFTIEGDFDGLPPIIRRTLYRVSQEALANVAHHAGIDTARLYLYVESGEVFLSIRDRGRGFDIKQALARERNRERFGLRGMQERVKALHGVCDILSEIDHGAQILVRLPIGRDGHEPE